MTAPPSLRSSFRHRLVFEVAFTRTLHQLDELGVMRDSNCSLIDVAAHLDEREPSEVLSLVELERESWEAAEEELQIARLEAEPDSRIELLRAVLDSAFDRLVQSIVDRALLPAARRYLNRFPQDSEAGVLRPISRSGLHQQLPPDFQLQTTTAAEVRRLMDQQMTAAIGIAGPRGSGKTTLIEWFTRDSSRRSDRYVWRTGQRRVFVSAPVQYDPRDFLLHLFAEVCLAIIGTVGDRRPSAKDYDKPREIGVKVVRTVYSLLLRGLVLLLGVVAAYLAYLLFDMYFAFPVGPEVVQQVFALVGVAWIGMNLSVLVRALHVEAQPFFGMLNRLRRPERPLTLLSFGALAGGGVVAYCAVQYQYVLDNDALTLIAGLPITVLMSIAVWRVLQWQQLNRPGVLDDWSIGSAVRRSKTELQRQAQDFLDQIHFQQTFTSGWGGKLTATSPVISGELSNSEGLSLSRLAWTLPETVKNLRRVLADAATDAAGIVVGIDELDKIEDPAAARRFVDDIKAVFHVPGCFFLVSVSDDAVTSFETRGLPFRDAFDSAFDEVVRVDYGNLENSRDVLNGRVVGLPVVFVALCHVLSGGLPRDLLRVTRYLLSLDVSRSAQLSALSVPLVQRELFAKIAPLLRRIVEVNASTVFSILSWAEHAAADWEDPHEIHDRLRDFSRMISALSADDSIPPQQRAGALRACSEAEVAYLLGCTVVEYCRLIDAPTIPIASSERLASLAVVRQKIAVHPVIAALQLQEFRRDESLPRLELWTEAAAASPAV